MTDWSPQQDKAITEVSKWLKDKNGPQIFRLFGYAGTGKTTLAKHLAKDVEKVAFMAFTGKAAYVLGQKGCPGASTIHSAIYITYPKENGRLGFKLNEKSFVNDLDLIVVDEVSMVGEYLGQDLESFGVKILVLGDPFQLPPIKGSGYFTDCEPDLMLTEIHRQATDNPIIHLATKVRQGEKLEKGTYGESFITSFYDMEEEDVLQADQMLVGKNKTRVHWNKKIREAFDFEAPDLPEQNDKLICLRNDHEIGLLNGGMWNVEKVACDPPNIDLTLSSIDIEDFEVEVTTHENFFHNRAGKINWKERKPFSEFDFGYAITVHKSQGSQWDNLFLYNEGQVFGENYERWLYTGITRAAERIIIAM